METPFAAGVGHMIGRRGQGQNLFLTVSRGFGMIETNPIVAPFVVRRLFGPRRFDLLGSNMVFNSGVMFVRRSRRRVQTLYL